MDNLFTLTSVGLAFDGAGVAILGYAFFSTPVSSLFLNSQTFWGGNAGVLEAGVETRTDGITGTSLLIIGFILQLLGAIGLSSEIAAKLLIVFLGLLLLLYFAFLRKAAINYQIRKAKEFEEKWKNKE